MTYDGHFGVTTDQIMRERARQLEEAFKIREVESSMIRDCSRWRSLPEAVREKLIEEYRLQ